MQIKNSFTDFELWDLYFQSSLFTVSLFIVDNQ